MQVSTSTWSNSFYPQILDLIHDAVHVVDTDYRFVGFNQAFFGFYHTLFNEPPQIGERGKQLSDELYREIVSESYSRGFRGEQFLISHSINNLYLDFSVTPNFNANKEVDYLIVCSRETTQTNLLLQQVTSQERKYQHLVESMNDIIYQADREGRFTFLNKAWEDILGYTVEESLGKDFKNFTIPEDYENTRIAFGPLFQKKIESCREEIRYVDKNGNIKWLIAHAKLLLNENGKILGTTGTLKDITGEKANAHLNELLLDNVRDIITLNNMEGKCIYISPSVEALTGYKPKEIIGQYIRNFYHPDDLIRLEKEGKLLRQDPDPNSSYEFRFKKKNGEYTWLEGTYKIFFDNYDLERRVISSSREITERKLAEEGLMKALQKERELNELKTRFVAMTAHEFKTPLSTIASAADIIDILITQLQDSRKDIITKQLSNIHSEIVRINKMMNETLFLGKIEAENTQVNRDEIDLVDVITYMADRQNKHQQDGRKLELIIEGTRRKVFADIQHLEHIVDNILSNAFKYSKEKESPKLILTFNDSDYQIKIIDFGIGIPQYQQKKVYTSFFRGNNVGGIKGTGLGLLIVHNLVKINGGEISFESTENVGTTFTINFPYF
ncbi:sensor histidine kinase [Arcicella rigui]|uniref:histidine kinase n=1 Tax=Arcicella rigui TaxID=797020 RepID=A0ABU5QAJ8_9BACT|nr:PAS domain-containing sensor histidine kinase [Arcicella rigui]MEA5139876.1 PAS domain-containing sensor histidine kinase [Arcicella rigui]